MQRETTFVERIFEGRLHHERKADVDHDFSYPVWWAMSRLQGSALPRLVRPRAGRYLDAGIVCDRLDLDPDDCGVLLLTQPSIVGRSFNPVSFYFAHHEGRLLGIVAHITNTPWDERYLYVLRARDDQTWAFAKSFHVSPFMPMDLDYRWRFRLRGDRIVITMQLFDRGHQVFVAVLNLKAVQVTRWTPLRLRIRYPLQNLATLWRIYWQAARLKLKGARFHAHPNHRRDLPDRQRTASGSG